MYTIHESAERIVSRESSYMLTIGFPLKSDYTTAAQNDFVKLNTTGDLSPIAATTDKPLGYIVSTYGRTANSEVRVACGFKCFIRGEADGTISPGQEVAVSGIDKSGTYETGAINKFKLAVDGDYVVGMCIAGGLTTTVECQIGIYHNPYLLAVTT